MATIQIALVVPRGQPKRYLEVDTARLSERQLRVLREYLPLDPKTGHPILKGPGKEPRSRECCVPDGDGVLQPANFTFALPDTVVDADAPALLDRWFLMLGQARARIQKRLARLDDAPATGADSPAVDSEPTRRKARRHGRATNDADLKLRVGQQDAGVEDDVALATAAADAAPDTAAVPAPRSLTQDASPAPTKPDDLDGIYRKLPLLKEFEVEGVKGPDAIVLPVLGGADDAVDVRAAVMRVVRFDVKGFDLEPVSDAIAAVFGAGWSDSDLVEDMSFRLEQANTAAQGAWEEYTALLAQLELKPSRSRKPRAPLAEMVELARHIRIDLDTAQHTREVLMADLQAHPSWAAEMAAVIAGLGADVIGLADSATLAQVLQAYEGWVAGVGVIQANAQMSLWTGVDDARLQRGIEHQVGRAKRWAEQMKRDAPAAIAALAVLQCGC
jgi:hypothetical protein